MQIENESTFRTAIQSGLGLFLGAGFSVLACGKHRSALPLGKQLAAEISARFGVEFADKLSLAQLCTVVEATQRSQLREFLEGRFRIESFDERYGDLERINLKSIFTTNIDDLLYRIFAKSTRYYLSDLDTTGPAYADRAAINVVYLHGFIDCKDRPLRFGTADLAAAFGADSDRWHYLTQTLERYPTLFWGYEVADAGTLQALSPQVNQGRAHKDKWILVHPSSFNEASRSYFAAMGFQIIVGSTEEMLQFLASTNQSAQTPRPATSTRELFPNAAVPTLGSIPRRPILDFFLGAPPQWSDVYSGVLHKTSHFKRIRNEVNSGHDIIVVGAPACGKTTLLMQLAAELQTPAHKLFYDSLTGEGARLLLAALQGQKALVFLDNCCDSMAAVKLLGESANVQLVGADRDYNFGFATHLMTQYGISVLEVTELNPADMQACILTIPRDIATTARRATHRDARAEPSLFELIEANTSRPTLQHRFKDVLMDLRRVDDTHHDTLLMVSYVHQCRVPVSMDMLIAFLRDTARDWQEVTKILQKIGAMVSDYVGDLVSGDQDYYVPRSTLVGETIIRAADDASLGRVIATFHTKVSACRICRYDVFRRRAYDADLFVRAFPNWAKGKDFYEFLYNRDGSPFLLQQAALYLSRKKRHSEAFTMIDKAIVESGNRQWSIRNSHAIIMFRANIGLAGDAGAKDSLRRSMGTLTECYRWDKRKLFHAVTFGQQALEYWDAYGDEDARGYLRTAENWINVELKSNPWHRQLKYILPRIQQILGGAGRTPVRTQTQEP
jgi:hypothetical protein